MSCENPRNLGQVCRCSRKDFVVFISRASVVFNYAKCCLSRASIVRRNKRPVLFFSYVNMKREII